MSPVVGEVAELGVAGDDTETVGDAAVGDRDARCGRDRDGAGHARHDLDLDAGVAAGDELLTAATEDVRIAALEPHDDLALLGPVDQDLVDLLLRDRVMIGHLADVDDLDVWGQLGEHAVRCEPVDHDDIGLREESATACGQQPRIAGSAADQRDESAGMVRAVAQRKVTGLQCRRDGIPQGGRPSGVTAAADSDRDVVDASRPRVPTRMRVIWIAALEAPDLTRLRPRRPPVRRSRDRLSRSAPARHRRGRRTRTGAGATRCRPSDRRGERVSDRWRDDDDASARGEQAECPASGDMATADDDHQAVGDAQGERKAPLPSCRNCGLGDGLHCRLGVEQGVANHARGKGAAILRIDQQEGAGAA